MPLESEEETVALHDPALEATGPPAFQGRECSTLPLHGGSVRATWQGCLCGISIGIADHLQRGVHGLVLSHSRTPRGARSSLSSAHSEARSPKPEQCPGCRPGRGADLSQHSHEVVFFILQRRPRPGEEKSVFLLEPPEAGVELWISWLLRWCCSFCVRFSYF